MGLGRLEALVCHMIRGDCHLLVDALQGEREIKTRCAFGYATQRLPITLLVRCNLLLSWSRLVTPPRSAPVTSVHNNPLQLDSFKAYLSEPQNDDTISIRTTLRFR
jgi:hypothetical protein